MESYEVGPGRYLVFNHTLNRAGTEFDVDAITNVFAQLNFKGDVHHDLTAKEIQNELFHAFQGDFTDFRSLIVFILSHGKEDNLILASDEVYDLEEYINRAMKYQSSTLIDKPKVFVIQACRGERCDEGVGFGGDSEGSTSGYKQPIHPDLLLAYAGPYGHCVFRDRNKGSYFIQTLCQYMVDPHYKYQDLESILKVTRQNVAGRKTHLKQIPLVVTTLMKDFYLTSPQNCAEQKQLL